MEGVFKVINPKLCQHKDVKSLCLQACIWITGVVTTKLLQGYLKGLSLQYSRFLKL